MTMAACFATLLHDIGELHACLRQRLQWAVLNARPMPGEHALAGRFEDWSLEIVSTIEDAEAAALRGEAAAPAGAVDLGATSSTLIELHRIVRHAGRLFHSKLASSETLDLLRQLASAEETRLWAPWADIVTEALIHCREPLWRLEDTVAEAWAQWAEIACAVAGNPAAHSCRQHLQHGPEPRPEDGGHANV